MVSICSRRRFESGQRARVPGRGARRLRSGTSGAAVVFTDEAALATARTRTEHDRHCESIGFSFVETLVAFLTITLPVTAGACLLPPADAKPRGARSETADTQQRLRVAADAVYRDSGRGWRGRVCGNRIPGR